MTKPRTPAPRKPPATAKTAAKTATATRPRPATKAKPATRPKSATPRKTGSARLKDDPRFFTASNCHGLYAVPRAYEGREIPDILARGEVYEPETIALLKSVLGDGDLVTGGAFVGDFFPALCSALAPNALLHSFEPVPLTAEAAQRTVALNGLTQVRLHPVAVSDEPGTLPLQINRRKSADPLAAGARIARGESGEHVIEVAVSTIDALVPADRRVSVLHLDVEGQEADALRGATRLIRAHKPIIVLEAGNRTEVLRYKRVLRDIAPATRYVIGEIVERNAVFRPFGTL